jgi:hypothetical protein
MRGLVIALLVCSAGTAVADGRKVMVLPADGRADSKIKQKVDAAVLKLAKTMPDTVTPGDVSYSDLAAAMGCKGEENSCRDEVLATLAVDEIVISTVNPKPGGFEVVTRRATKAGNSKDAVIMVTSDAPDKVDAIAPLFVGKATTASAGTPAKPPATPTTPTPPTTPTITTTPPPTTPTTPTTTTTPAISTTTTTPTEPLATTDTPPVEPPKTEPAPVKPVPAPVVEPHDDNRGSRRRLYIAGMAGGGAMLIVGLVLWGQADSIQSDIDKAPTKTKADLARLVDLEASGDRYATWGNVFAIGGFVLAGVSTYYFIKHRHSGSSTSAHLVPAVFDHGAGVALSFGAP